MELNWSTKVIKYAMFVFNLLFVISGIIILSIGVSVKAYYHNYHLFLDGKYFSLPNLLIATGSLIFIISFLGCCGAIKESWLMMVLFTGCLILIFILEFSAGIAGYVLRDKTSEYLKGALLGEMKYYNTNQSEVTILWDQIQTEFECCGVNDPSDWVNVFSINPDYNKGDLPWSCCKSPYGSVGPLSCHINETVPVKSLKVRRQASGDGDDTNPTTTNGTTIETTPVKTTESEGTTTTNTTTTTSVVTTTQLPTTTTIDTITTTKSSTDKFADYYHTGCTEGFGKYLKSHAVTLGGVGMALACIQLLGILFSIHLARKIKQGNYYST